MTDQQVINNRYKVIRELGRGGMGQVYLVEDTHADGMQLALKTLLPKLEDARFLQDFKVEFSELAKLRHPNVATAYDFGRISGSRENFFTTEFVAGVDLFKATEKVTIDQLLDITAQLLRGLDFIHSGGLLHNDLKPKNILVQSLATKPDTGRQGDMAKLEAAVYGMAGRVKLIDFGLLSAEGVAWQKIRGTPRYLSPERILCKAADRRSDLYSLGCVLFVLFARKPPFNHTHPRELLKLHLQMAPPPIQEFCGDLPDPVIALIHKCLQKRPENRFNDARTALRFLGEGLGWDATAFETRVKTPEVVAGSLLFREKELGVLGDKFKSVSSTKAKKPCVVIEGPEGVGKSCLVDEFRTLVQVKGGAFIGINGQALRRHLRPIFDTVVGDLKRIGVRGVDEVQKMASGEEGEGDTPTDLAYRLEKVIFWYAARMPMVIHFDDFQHASEIVRRFANQLIHSTCERLARTEKKPRLLILISRDSRRRGHQLPMDGTTSLNLEAFSQETSCSYLRRIYGQDDIPEAVLSTLANIAQGNPRLLLELAKSLVDEKLVKYNGTCWVFPSTLEGLSLPGSLADSMHSRLAVLGSQASSVLECISICRVPPTASLIKRCTFLEDDTLRLVLKRLRGDGLLTSKEEDDNTVYDTAQQGLKAYVIERIDAERRTFLHQRLAQNLEEEHGSVDPGEDCLSEILAYHWLEAGNIPGFLRFAEGAAAYLQKSGNHELAVDYRRRIVESMPCEATAKKIKSLVKLSEMHEFLWDLERSQKNLETILQLGQDLLKPGDRLALLRRMATISIARQAHGKALELIEEARSLAPPTAEPVVGLSIDAPEAWARWGSGDQEGAMKLKEKAEKLLDTLLGGGERSSDAKTRALCVASANHLANLNQYAGYPRKAIALHQQNLNMLEGLGMKQAEAACQCAMGAVLLESARHENAKEHLTTALDLGREIGDRKTLCRAREKLGLYHFLFGDLRRALHITHQGLEDAQAINHLPAMANSLRLLGRIYQRVEQNEDATKVLKRALAIHRDTADVLEACVTRVHLAKRLVVEGKTVEALQHLNDAAKGSEKGLLASGIHKLAMAEAHRASTGELDQELTASAEAILRKGEYLREVCNVKIFLCRGALDSDDLGASKEAFKELEELLPEAGSKEQHAEANYLRARLDILEGKTDDAYRELKELERWAANNNFPQLLGRCTETSQEMTIPG